MPKVLVVPIVSDADAQAFLNAANITSGIQANAINNLVIALKGYSIWTKFKAIYPIVGGSASSHKFNLKDPRDLDVAFRLTFSTGVTHSSNGMVSNGTTGYANTFLSAPNITLYDAHISFYSRTQVLATNNNEVGCAKSPNTNQLFSLSITRNTGIASACHTSQALSTHIALAPGQTSSQGLFMNNRLGANATDLKVIRNGTVLATATTNGTNITTNLPSVFILALNNFITANNPAFYSTKQCAFASIGDGLTDTEAANFYTAVQAFQTSLGRQV
jgi:hypothetical protein